MHLMVLSLIFPAQPIVTLVITWSQANLCGRLKEA